jgi:hypothetical protein
MAKLTIMQINAAVEDSDLEIVDSRWEETYKPWNTDDYYIACYPWYDEETRRADWIRQESYDYEHWLPEWNEEEGKWEY